DRSLSSRHRIAAGYQAARHCSNWNMTMRYASITDRLANLGSDKWELHLRGRALAARDDSVIELTIGEPDVPPDGALLDICNEAMRAGRTRYSNGRGEESVVSALARKYSHRTGREIG